ncbi:hypothetical protein PIB30_026350 [Stylosanthes scabra]|uniref:GRF-type domain-containing protein n=1 Tax=Stylosanthes scabra TaxID=79078 RepID=A0ABU6Z716_9FABA|nr:hypothetical protein [Stylosanthes scabra]
MAWMEVLNPTRLDAHKKYEIEDWTSEKLQEFRNEIISEILLSKSNKLDPSVHFRHFSADMAVKLDTLVAMLSDACFVGYLTQGSGCSSRSRGQSSWARTPSRGRASKVPKWCGCGLRPILKWLGTELNPDRPFYVCPKYNTSRQRWCGFFVWADGGEDEGTEGRANFETKVDPLKINFGNRVSKLEDELRVLKCWVLGLSFVMMVVLFGIVGNCLGLGK